MKKVRFVYDECENTGYLGLIPKDISSGNLEYFIAATSGFTVAHDLIEHDGLNTIGGIGNELEALGALWWIRGSLDDINRNQRHVSCPEEVMVYEINDVLQRSGFKERGFELAIPRTRYCTFDADFIDIIARSKDELSEDIEKEVSERYFNACLHFLRSGYRKATRRYRRLNQRRVNTLFWNIADAIDEAVQSLHYQYQELELRYCLTSTEVSCRLIEEDF